MTELAHVTVFFLLFSRTPCWFVLKGRQKEEGRHFGGPPILRQTHCISSTGSARLSSSFGISVSSDVVSTASLFARRCFWSPGGPTKNIFCARNPSVFVSPGLHHGFPFRTAKDLRSAGYNGCPVRSDLLCSRKKGHPLSLKASGRNGRDRLRSAERLRAGPVETIKPTTASGPKMAVVFLLAFT